MAGAVVHFKHHEGEEFEAVADANGAFALTLPPGTYNGNVTAEGMAASRVKGLEVKVGEDAFYNFVVLRRFHSDWPVRAPQVNITGLESGASYSTSIPFRIVMESANYPRAIYVAVGHTPGQGLVSASQLSYEDTSDTGQQVLSGTLLAGQQGSARLEVVAYDQNNNRLHQLIPIVINQHASPEPALASPVVKSEVYTFSQLLELQAVTTRDYSIVSKLSWQDYDWSAAAGAARGFRVYRHYGQARQLLATLPASETHYYDRGPGLEPGVAQQYSVVAFSGSSESPAAEVTVTPLPPFRVELLEPGQGQTVGPTPVFSWRAVPEVGAARYYLPVLWDTFMGSDIIVMSGVPIREHTYAWSESGRPPLMPGRTYGWELAVAYAVDDVAAPSAYSVAVDRQRRVSEAYLPGPSALFEVR